mgnify:CR=1 FL=1
MGGSLLRASFHPRMVEALNLHTNAGPVFFAIKNGPVELCSSGPAPRNTFNRKPRNFPRSQPKEIGVVFGLKSGASRYRVLEAAV